MQAFFFFIIKLLFNYNYLLFNAHFLAYLFILFASFCHQFHIVSRSKKEICLLVFWMNHHHHAVCNSPNCVWSRVSITFGSFLLLYRCNFAYKSICCEQNKENFLSNNSFGKLNNDYLFNFWFSIYVNMCSGCFFFLL